MVDPARLAWQLLALLLWAVAAEGYNLGTHSGMSQHAYGASSISTYVRSELALDPNDEFEGPPLIPIVADRQRLDQWLIQGAEDEDDTVALGVNPNSFFRYVNHFYNPLDDSGLHFGGIIGRPSPDWGIELSPISGQDFSFADARSYFDTALTAKDPKDREHSLARTLLTLGHVIHLIQDAAQPQHTRNDSHGPTPFGGLSLYEQYTEANLDRVAAAQLFDGYPPVYRPDDTTTFNFMWDFWHRPGGMGLADYSNRGFVSARTNFTATVYTPLLFSANPDFPKPDNVGASVEQVAIGDLLQGTNLSGDIDFIATPVDDNYTSSQDINHRTSSYSIFDPDLKQYNQAVTVTTPDGGSYETRAVFSLNRFNFEAAWPFLIPRAVGYSAGLLNYFFRGRLDFVPDPNNAANFLIENRGPEDMYGMFTLYYDQPDGTRQKVAGSNDWVLTIPAGQAQSVHAFDTPFVFMPAHSSPTPWCSIPATS